MLSFEDARQLAVEKCRRLAQVEVVELAAAQGRALALDVLAPYDLPAFDYSAMDGYAVCSRDLAGEGPFELPVVGESQTGHPVPEFAPGSAMRIFTGAELPSGADSVILQEDVERGGNQVRFRAAPRADENVRRRGEDLKSGQMALSKGTLLGPFQLSFLAMLDCTEVSVAARPRVAILCTGDELYPPGAPRPRGCLPESNSWAVRAMAEMAGAEVVMSRSIPDRGPEIEAAFREAVECADLVVSIGGVSVGDHDLVRPSLIQLGASLDFWKVKMKPGKPILMGELGSARIIGLPGNPASAQITFALFGLPMLRALSGQAECVPRQFSAKLATEFRQKPGRVCFLRARLEGGVVTPLGNQASGAGTALAWANALAIIPAETEHVSPGETVDLIPFSCL